MTLRLGLIGTGAIGKTHIERINTVLQGAKVVACADPNAVFGLSVAEQYQLKGYDNPSNLIASEDVDAIIITAHDDYHAQYVLESIEHNKYVFCEKPLAPKAETCKKIVEAEVQRGKKFVQVGFMRRYDAGYRQLKQYIESREFGEPLILHCVHRNPTVAGFGFTTPMSVENSMIHEIDVIRWLLNEDYDKVEVVFPKTTRNTDGELRDPQIMYLTTKSGVRIDVESFVNCQYGYDVRCEVVFENGCVNLPEPPNTMLRKEAARVTPICRSWSERFPDAYNVEFQAWINGVLNDRVDGPTAWDGYVAQVTASAASQARDEQKMVQVSIEEMPKLYK